MAQLDYRRRLYESYASGFAGDGTQSRAGRTLRAEVLRHVPADREARILDLGCGQGELLGLLREGGYRHLTGVDISEEQLVLARRRGVGEIVEQGDLEPWLAERPAAFDVVIAVDVLEHFDKPEVLTLLDAAAAALAPAGTLIVRVPNATGPYAGRLRYGDFTHGLAFTEHSLRQVLAAVGFTEVKTHDTRPAAHGAASAVRLMLWWVLSALRRLALAVETGELRAHPVSQNLVGIARWPGRAPRSDPPLSPS